MTSNALPFTILALVIAVLTILKIIFSTLSCILCRSAKVVNAQTAETKTYEEVMEEWKRSHPLYSYDIRANPDYNAAIVQMNKISAVIYRKPNSMEKSHKNNKPSAMDEGESNF